MIKTVGILVSTLMRHDSLAETTLAGMAWCELRELSPEAHVDDDVYTSAVTRKQFKLSITLPPK